VCIWLVVVVKEVVVVDVKRTVEREGKFVRLLMLN
jgi:hypothetical protein